MPVPTYPSAITLADIQTEFGGSNPIGINEYYAGGSYVLTGTANSTGTAIPSSGAINLLNFSGAAAGRYWYYKRIPSTIGMQFPYIGNISLHNGYLLRGGGLSNFYPYVMAIPIGSGNTEWGSDLRVGSSNTTIPGGYTQVSSISPNGTFSICTTSSGTATLVYRFYTANGTQVANANTTGMGGWHTMLATNDGYIKVQPGYNTANILIAKWSGAGATLDWYYAANLSTFYSHGGAIWNSDYSRLIWIGYYSTPNKGTFQCLNASDGSHVWGSVVNSGSVHGVPTTDTRMTDSSNNFYVRWTTQTRDFSKLTDSGSSLTEAWRKAVPSGNTINMITNDSGGNVYVATQTSWNSYLTKVQSDGTVSWTRLLYSVRADSDDFGVVFSKVACTTSEFVAIVSTTGYTYDAGKNSWQPSGINEQHILRLPIDGSKTGTYSNLVYASVADMSLTAQSAIGLTANARSNGALFNFPTALTANTQANTCYLVTNNTIKFTGTTIS